MRALFIAGVIALGLAGCAGDSALTPKDAVLASSTNDAAQAAALISAYRVSKGLSPVTVDPRLNKAAEHQARVVAAAGQLSHGSFVSRMDEYGISGYSAENLSAGQDSVDSAIGRWKASPGHNSNLLMPQARKIGLARADADNRYGRYWALVLGQ
ncbi:CAP domain-containing protein [Microvirga terrestris]|uniref:CAP domain-containing protein n=1 Tax=Microvirga terrestris TaxID=2791024 RepID=A0ABS0HS48_9HYPH|nr:CAP domain-containing protein [Microvirga terrestris]MBF9196305.1 CAP domain-containing protein [Microvirga terrestris]